jgi:hypothetical protein
LKQENKTLFSKKTFQNYKKHFGSVRQLIKNKNIEVEFKQPKTEIKAFYDEEG